MIFIHKGIGSNGQFGQFGNIFHITLSSNPKIPCNSFHSLTKKVDKICLPLPHMIFISCMILNILQVLEIKKRCCIRSNTENDVKSFSLSFGVHLIYVFDARSRFWGSMLFHKNALFTLSI